MYWKKQNRFRENFYKKTFFNSDRAIGFKGDFWFYRKYYQVYKVTDWNHYFSLKTIFRRHGRTEV